MKMNRIYKDIWRNVGFSSTYFWDVISIMSTFWSHFYELKSKWILLFCARWPLASRRTARSFLKTKQKLARENSKLLFFSFFRTDDPIVVENSKSHGSVTVRYGAIIFGLGAFCYFFIELLVFLEHKPESPCFHPLIGANTIMALLFVFLQTYILFMYPRLNFQCHKFFNR